MDPTAALASDARSLDALRTRASGDPRGALRDATRQFEALFVREVLKSMRAAIPESGLTTGTGHQVYQDMLDSQLAQSLAGRPGGLAQVLLSQLERQLAGRAAPSSPAALDAGATGPAAGPANVAAARPARATPAAPTNEARVSMTGVLPSALRRALGDERVATPQTESASATPQAQFVRAMWPHALAAQRSTGVRAELVVGQAALESGWGRSEMRHADGSPSHNLFGIKAGSSWKGATVDVVTTEYVDGEARKQVERFRAYGSYAEAFADWASLVGSNPRYSRVAGSGGSVQSFADGLQKAGYATDPAYSEKLQRVIEKTIALRRVIS